MAAILREHLRIGGQGISQTKKFRDKLIMRDTTAAHDIPIPAYSRVVNHHEVYEYMQRVPPPWVLKPRLEAGAMGIKRVNHQDELWGLLEFLGDQQSFRVLEQYLPGDVYHVDSMTVGGETVFANVSRYAAPPLNVAHEGGVFMTYTLDANSDDALALKKLNRQIIHSFGLTDCPTHAEFIKAHHDGQFYFLEIAARVGGAHIADLVEHATNINLWREWARLEVALAEGKPYHLPQTKQLYGGLLVSLARQQRPDTSAYNDTEVVWRMDDKEYHAGLIVASDSEQRTHELLYSYRDRFISDFLAVAPPRDKPAD
jgi:carbamoylphosphate synthase large subunit